MPTRTDCPQARQGRAKKFSPLLPHLYRDVNGLLYLNKLFDTQCLAFGTENGLLESLQDFYAVRGVKFVIPILQDLTD